MQALEAEVGKLQGGGPFMVGVGGPLLVVLGSLIPDILDGPGRQKLCPWHLSSKLS